MLDFLNLKPEFFGLDISDFSLKIAKIKKGREFLELESFGETEIAPGIIKKGEIKKQEELTRVIKKAILEVKGEKIKTKYVICSLPEESAFLQVVKMPRMSKKDLESAILYDAENYIPLPIEKVYLDFQVISFADNSKEIEVLIAALPRKSVDPYISCLKKAGLQPLCLEVESLAIARALIKNKTSDKTVLLIDLGFTKTGFIVFSGNCVRFSTFIPVSSQSFTKIVAKALNVGEKEAEKLKIKHGLEGKIHFTTKRNKAEKKIEQGRVFEALIPALTDLLQQIKNYITYYKTHPSFKHFSNNHKEIEKILLCGGGANLKGLSELLSIELKIPVELGNSLINISPNTKKKMPKAFLEKSLAYTTAIGLALGGKKQG